MPTISFQAGVVSVGLDLEELVYLLSAGEKRKMAESLSCDDDIINLVADQIIFGCTENGYYGSKNVTASVVPHSGLDKACRAVAKASGEVAKKEIERLEGALKESEARNSELALELANCRPF